MASIGTIITSTYHTKQLNPWPHSSTSCVVNYSQLSAFQGNMEPFEGDPNTCGHLTSLKTKVVWATYIINIWLNWYSYCLMVKLCFDVVFMEASFSQIRSHMVLQTNNCYHKIVSIGVIFSCNSNFNLFSLYTLAWACVLQFKLSIMLVSLISQPCVCIIYFSQIYATVNFILCRLV